MGAPDERPSPRRLYGTRCSRCPFAKEARPCNPVLGDGPLDAKGILVGESPGRDEAERGKPFVGWTGQALDDVILAVGLRRSDLFIVNAVCCRPAVGSSETDMRKAVECCRPALIGQLEQVASVPVLGMGKWAHYALTGKTKGLKNSRGFVRRFSLEDTKAANAVIRKAIAIKKKREERRKKRGVDT